MFFLQADVSPPLEEWRTLTNRSYENPNEGNYEMYESHRLGDIFFMRIPDKCVPKKYEYKRKQNKRRERVGKDFQERHNESRLWELVCFLPNHIHTRKKIIKKMANVLWAPVRIFVKLNCSICLIF